MKEAAVIACTWLHLVVLVIWIGHMVNSLILFGPLASKYVSKSHYGEFIAAYRAKDRPVSIICIVIFIITGLVLTLLNEQYQGFGNVLANSWSTTLLIKHILVLAMIGLGLYIGTRVMPDLAEAGKKLAHQNDAGAASEVARLEKVRKRVNLSLCILAMLVLLLTAIGETL
jgi:uncharacterized membrane protein